MNSNKGAMQELVDRALEGKHSEFQLLSEWNQYFYVRKFIKATLKVWDRFKKVKKDLIKKAGEMIQAGEDPIAYVVALKEVAICLKYYSAEVDLAWDMADEYIAYVRSWHLVDSILGLPRAEEDMYDHRRQF